MSDMKPQTLCKHCKYWPVYSIKFPCRACTNEGRSPHPMPGDKFGNHYKRRPNLDVMVNQRLVDEKKRGMGL